MCVRWCNVVPFQAAGQGISREDSAAQPGAERLQAAFRPRRNSQPSRADGVLLGSGPAPRFSCTWTVRVRRVRVLGEGATGPADARPAEPSSSTAGRAPPRRFSAHWRAEEAAGVAAGIGGGASSVLGSEADFERRSIDLRAGRWVALGHRRRRGGRRRPEERLGRVAHMLPAK